MAVLCWLLLRSDLRFGEWVLLLVVVAAANLTAQLTAGSSHNGVFAINTIGIFALVCLLFETQLVVIAATLFAASYAVAQLHFYSTGDSAAAILMYAIELLLMGVIVHGTAHYLREALRTTGQLHAQMDETAERSAPVSPASCTTTQSRC